MTNNTVVCWRCRGQKECAGIGGIVKKCTKCNGKGRIEQPVVAMHNKVVQGVIDTTVEAVAIPTPLAEIKAEIKATPKRKSRAKAKAVEPVGEPETADMFPEPAKPAVPTVDDFTQAILDEPRMDPIAWEAKYKHISRLFGINPMTQKFDCLVTQVQRAAIRANYAANQPRVARKVNVKKAQDMVAESDADYLEYKHREEAREANANAT